MKERELRELATCGSCGRKVGECGSPFIWKLTIERHIVDIPAVQRQSGLAMMLGGHGLLAQVMGPDEDMTKPVMNPRTVGVCDDCACRSIVLAQVVEDVTEGTADKR